MSNPAISQLVQQAVKAWLCERQELLDIIMDDVANELAPIVADRVRIELDFHLTRTSDENLVHQMALACKRALDLVDVLIENDSDVEVPAYEPISTQLAAVLRRYTFLFGSECLTKPQTAPSGQGPFDDLPEGQ